MIITTQRLRLEPVTTEHIDDLLQVHADSGVAHWFHGSWGIERARTWAAQQQESWRQDGTGRWMAYRLDDSELIGRGGPCWTNLGGRRVIELGWVVRDRWCRQGFGAEMGHASIEHAFNILGMSEVFAYTEVTNAASRGVMRRLGMTEAGPMDYPGDLEPPDGRPYEAFVLYRRAAPQRGWV